MKYIVNFLSLLLITVAFHSCADLAEGDTATYEEDLVTSFLEKQPETYSEFLDLLRATEMIDLLDAYGNYTCFVPTNEAMVEYYESNGWSSSVEMPDSAKREFLYGHIVSGRNAEDVYFSSRFPQSRLEIPAMNNRLISIHSEVDTENNKVQIYVGEGSPIIILDQKVHNGVIHTLGKVLLAADIQLAGVIASNGRFSWFARALTETQLDMELKETRNTVYDSIRAIVDPDGEGVYSKAASQSTKYPTPAICWIQYTALVESDATYQAALKAKGLPETYEGLQLLAKSIYDPIYPQYAYIADVTDRNNSFNRFIAYHLLDRSLFYKEFLAARANYYSAGYIENKYSEYVETMCPNTLLEIKPLSSSQWDIPVFNKREGYPGVSIVSSCRDREAENGVYHEINRVLSYEGMTEELSNKRIRLDATLLLPEMTTNALRGNISKSGGNGWIIPQGYFKNLTYTEETTMEYWGASGATTDLECDELLFFGKYDLTLRLPPVPAGTYEVRFGYTANTTGRGVAQIFFDGKPCGIPLNLKIGATDPAIGSKSDADLKTPEAIAENDKMMHNRGYMKGPNGSLRSEGTLRGYSGALRRVVFTGTFDTDGPHYLRVKNVEDDLTREFMIDYIEFAPKSIWEGEDIE